MWILYSCSKMWLRWANLWIALFVVIFRGISIIQDFCQASATIAFWKHVKLNVPCLNGPTTTVFVKNGFYGTDPLSSKFCINRLLNSLSRCFSYTASTNRFISSFLRLLCSLFFSIDIQGSTTFLLLGTSIHVTSDFGLKNIFKYYIQNYTGRTGCLPL